MDLKTRLNTGRFAYFRAAAGLGATPNCHAFRATGKGGLNMSVRVANRDSG
jgi:hypothetical protein